MIRRNAIVGLSFANLLYFRVWLRLLTANPVYFGAPSLPTELAAMFAGIALIAALFTAAACLCAKSTSQRWKSAGLSLALLVTVAAFRPARGEAWLWSHAGWLGLAGWILLLGCVFFAALRWHKYVIKVGKAALMIGAPVVVVTFAHALMDMAAPGRLTAYAKAPVVPRQHALQRVVWIIFDEMDEAVAFSRRPHGLALPEFDRFRSQALEATSAYPPAQWTMVSMPALIDGELLVKAVPDRSGDLELVAVGGAEKRWSREPNVFSEARQSGYRTAIVGAYHPYCRVLAASLDECYSQHTELPLEIAHRRGLLAALGAQLAFVGETMFRIGPYDLRLRERAAELERKVRLDDYRNLLPAAKAEAADKKIDLLLIHLAVPHPPAFYDRQHDHLDDSAEHSYVDGVALADKALGELRRTMQQAGAWDNSVVLISSDHWWRADLYAGQASWSKEDAVVSGGIVDHRIPFMLHFPAQDAPLSFPVPFNTVISKALLLKILRGEVRDAAAAAAWINSHSTIAAAQYLP